MAAPFRMRLAMLSIALVALAGCTVKVHRVAVESTRVVTPLDIHLACGHRLGEVVDARPSSERAGGLGMHMFVFEDVPGTVRRQFEQAGLDAGTSGPVVDVRILQFYLSQNTITKIPVAVYQVRVDGGEPFLVRSQRASMNWNGSENEAYHAYATALSDAAEQVVARLNASCPATG